MLFCLFFFNQFYFSSQNCHFIHCMKPNNESLPNKFDENFVSTQLNTIGAVPIANLVRRGYAAKLSYNELISQIVKYMGNRKAINYPKDLCEIALNLVGCTSYKFGRSQVFFRPKSEHFIKSLTNLDESTAKNIASQVISKFIIRQRRVLMFAFKFFSKYRVSNFPQFSQCK